MAPQKLRRRQTGEAQDLEGVLPPALLAGGVAVCVGRGIARHEPVEGRGDALTGAAGGIGGRFLAAGGGRRRCLFVLGVSRRRLLVGLVDALVAPVDVLEVRVEVELLVLGVVVAGRDAPAAAGEEAEESTAAGGGGGKSFRFF